MATKSRGTSMKAIKVGDRTRIVKPGSKAESKYLSQGGKVVSRSQNDSAVASARTAQRSASSSRKASDPFFRAEAAGVSIPKRVEAGQMADFEAQVAAAEGGQRPPIPQAPTLATPQAPTAPVAAVSATSTPTGPQTPPSPTQSPTGASTAEVGQFRPGESFEQYNSRMSKYFQGLKTAQASGIAAPQDAGAARGAIAQYTPQTPDTAPVNMMLSEDPVINTLMQGVAQLLNPKQQTSTLMQDYEKLYKASGLKKINAELIDAETVINGTEDDIRNEIQTAGGMGTESQIQAMSLARNKSLLTRYNQLVQMKQDATNQLSTMMQLNAQDKQMAQQRVDSQINSMFQMANFRQTAINAARETYGMQAQAIGWDGVYAGLSKDPVQLARAESILGLSAGGLASFAQSAEARRKAAITPVQVSPGNRLVDPTTGKVIYTAPAEDPFGLGGGGTGGTGSILDAIVGIESGGNYKAVSPVLPSGWAKGQRSYGKYQILESNIGPWSEQFYGKRLTPQEFLNNNEAQDAVARGHVNDLYAQYGNVEDVASVYFTGVPYAQAVREGRKDQATGMTVQAYVDGVKRNMGGSTGSTGNNLVQSYADGVRNKTINFSDVPKQLQPAVSQAMSTPAAPDPLAIAQQQADIETITGLVTDKGLSSAVGPNPFARMSLTSMFTGERQNFIAGVEQVRSQLNLDTLIQAKGSGATFGALSDQELKVLANAATRLGSWAVKNNGGDVVGYNIDEGSFKRELDQISNFAKLDFVLKGGDPSVVDVEIHPDGSYWTESINGRVRIR